MPSIAILTRPDGRNEPLAHGLATAGWRTLILPALALQPLPIAAADLPLPQDFDLVVFVSGYAARAYLTQLAELAGQAQWPVAVPTATVGAASARALRDLPGFGINTTVFSPPLDAPTHDSEALWQVLQAQSRLPARVLLVRSTHGRDWLGEQFEAAGVCVQRHAAYQREAADWLPDTVQQLQNWAQQGEKVTWLLTSGEGLAAIASRIRAAGLTDWWRASDFIVTHPTLVHRLRQAGGGTSETSMVKTCLPDNDAILAAFVAA